VGVRRVRRGWVWRVWVGRVWVRRVVVRRVGVRWVYTAKEANAVYFFLFR
jgi:hypothetical protein